MTNLLTIEFKKYKRTVIKPFVFGGSVLLSILFLVGFNYIRNNSGRSVEMMNWETLQAGIMGLQTDLFLPLVSAFLIIWMINFEYKSGAIKLLSASPNNKGHILLSKITYSALLLISFEMIILGLTLISGLVLQLDMSLEIFLRYFGLHWMNLGLIIALMPIPALLAVVLRSFSIPFTISVLGIFFSSALKSLYNGWLSPWSTYSNITKQLMAGKAVNETTILVYTTYCVISAVVLIWVFNVRELSE